MIYHSSLAVLDLFRESRWEEWKRPGSCLNPFLKPGVVQTVCFKIGVRELLRIGHC